jgi:hypothetical protein
VPAEFALSAREILELRLRDLRPAEFAGSLLFDWEEETVVDPPLLRETNPAILRRGPEVIPDLVAILWRGEEEARTRAGLLLSDLGVAGAQALTEVARKAIVERDRDRLRPVVSALAKVRGYRPDETFSPFLEDEDPTVRALAALVVGRTGSKTCVPLLVPLLEDADVEVREEAIEALYTLTGDDLGFEAEAPEDERAAAVARWRKRV